LYKNVNKKPAEARKGHAVSEETREKIRKTLAETRAKKKALLSQG